jgi:RNA polymerase sigma factor (sigma-70 family)
MAGPSTTDLQASLDRLRAGDSSARDALLESSRQRLVLLARRMLRRFPGVRRWEETDDVCQRVLLRLDRLLETVQPTSVRDYLRLASMHTRHVLIDLARHYHGPEGIGTHHASPARRPQSTSPPADSPPAADVDDPAELVAWEEFHLLVEKLPAEEREVFDLLWYQGVSQKEAAGLLGLSLSTVKRRWLSARLRVGERLGEHFSS